MRYTAILAALVLALPTGRALAGGPPDSCKLIGADAAGKILDAKVTVKPINTYGAPASHCMYSTGHGGGFSLLVGRIHYKNAAAELARQKKTAVESWPPSMAKPTFTDVKGIGDAATLLKGQGYFQLHVLAHGTAIVINMNRQANADTVKRVEKLARIALDHLEKEE